MPTVITHDMLVRRALAFVLERRADRPGAALAPLLDEAGQRFNLSPADTEALEHALRQAEKGAAAADATPEAGFGPDKGQA